MHNSSSKQGIQKSVWLLILCLSLGVKICKGCSQYTHDAWLVLVSKLLSAKCTWIYKLMVKESSELVLLVQLRKYNQYCRQ